MENVVKKAEDLEALPVDDAGACLVVLLLGDPHLLEGGQGSQDGATDPDGVLPLGGSNDLEEEEEEILGQKCAIFFKVNTCRMWNKKNKNVE